MLVNMKEMLEKAAENEYAIPGFNVYGYEDAVAVIEAAEKLKAPVILMANKDAVEHMEVEILGPLLTGLANTAGVPVVVHLDHAGDYSLIVRAIKSDFSSVMYDGSQLSIKENICRTGEIVKLARACGVTVEAEIGSVGYSDPSIKAKAVYTDVGEAEKFAEETGVDALAVAIGTIHRMKIQEALIQFDRLAEIEKAVNTPLVIHGSSGVKDTDLRKMIKHRVAKVNIGTALRMAFGNTLRKELIEKEDVFDRIKLFEKPMEAVKEAVLEKYSLLGF